MRLHAAPRRLALRRAAGGLALAVACALGGGCGSAVAQEAATSRAIDPHYGDGLFHFYQDQYFDAVVGLMVSQHFERIAMQADDAEVLRGSMLLSYGLHREAGAIFATLIDKGVKPSVRDRAWFFLAKIRYQRGYLAEAEDAIAHVGDALPPQLAEDRVLLQAQLAMARGDFAGAARTLSALSASKPGAGPYTRFNLGVAMVRSGDVAGGSAQLDALGREKAFDEEQRSLRDRANLALGFAALQEHQPEAARGFLERVRLNGMQSNKALLGYGWAASELKQPKQAMVPWSELVQRGGSDAAVLEARLALAYAYAKVGALGQSMQHYDDAIAAYASEGAALDESIAAIRGGVLLTGLLERNPGTEMGWFWNIRRLPDMPHAQHLAPLLAQHDFQEAFKNYRDLQFLSNNLAQWNQNLGVYADMLANRRAAFAQRLPQTRAQASAVNLAALRQRHDALAAELQRAEADPSGAAFFDAHEGELLARLASARALADALGDGPEAQAARERLRRVEGAMRWRLAGQQPQRLWQAKKSIAGIEERIDTARRVEAALAQAERDEPRRFEAFAARIAELNQRVAALAPRVAALSAEQQAQIQALALAELQRQKARLGDYATQARFAVAQLQDQAYAKREGEHASR